MKKLTEEEIDNIEDVNHQVISTITNSMYTFFFWYYKDYDTYPTVYMPAEIKVGGKKLRYHISVRQTKSPEGRLMSVNASVKYPDEEKPKK